MACNAGGKSLEIIYVKQFDSIILVADDQPEYVIDCKDCFYQVLTVSTLT